MEAIIITEEDMEAAEYITEILTDLIQNFKKAIEALAETLIQLAEGITKTFRKVIDIIRDLYFEIRRAAPNNWLKMHGLPMRRRSHISRST